jgi:uncharacterized protein
MKYSRFTVFCEEGDKTILFNTLNKRLKVIPNQLRYLDINTSKILKSQLSDFLVKDDVEDDQNVQYLINSMVYQSTRLNITLMMTMKCNFKCIYCFESWIPREEKQRELDEDEVIDWIIWLVKKYHIRQVDLCFHGGEPLLEIDKIKKIAEKLKAFFLSNGVFYLFTIVTNGYLLNEKNAKVLADAGIKIAQITIDGVEEIHDQRRPLANGKGTFKTILNNIENNLYMKIYISIIYDNRNANNVRQLIDFLNERNLQNKIHLIVLSETKPTIELNNVSDFQLSQREAARLRVDLLKYITDSGFRVPFDVDYQLCTMKQKSSFVITPDKSIYKCISGVGNDAFKLCTLKIGEDPYKMQAHIIESGENNDCKQCQYMPICNRYCLYESFVMNCSKICRKAYWDEFMKIYFPMYLMSNHKDKFILNPSAEEWELCYHE